MTTMICIGRRMFNRDKGQTSYAFVTSLKKNAPVSFFTKVKYVQMGSSYPVEKKDNSYQMSTRPESVKGVEVPDQILDQWRIAETEADVFMRRVKQAKKSERLAKTVAAESYALRRALKGLSFTAKRAFVDHIIDEIENLEKAKK